MSRNSTQYVCLNVLAAVVLCGVASSGQARENAGARAPKPADVTVYVNGDDWPPNPVDLRARATVTWMYARIGIRLCWRNDAPGGEGAHGGPVIVQVRFAKEVPDGVGREALARAWPFRDEGVVAIDLFYDRIRWTARRLSREAPILAHVLAHEIGHVLQRTNAHALSGVMKACWNSRDLDAMERKPLEFTSFDVDLIKCGLMRDAKPGSSAEVLR